MNTPGKRESPAGRPGSRNTNHPPKRSTPILPSIPDIFAPLTEQELALVLHPAVVAAERRGYESGYRRGFTEGAMWARATCLTDHADLLTQLDAARRFAELGGRQALEEVRP